MSHETASWIPRRGQPYWWRTWPVASSWRGFLSSRSPGVRWNLLAGRLRTGYSVSECRRRSAPLA
jgi:hypothetical protein